MKKVCLIAFLCCILVSYATEPLDIFRVKSIAFYYDNKWSPEGEYKGVIMLFDDRIVNKSDTGLGEFRIVGEVELTKNPFGNSAIKFECVNQNFEECIIEITYVEKFNRRCMYIRYPTHDVRYILKNDDEY